MKLNISNIPHMSPNISYGSFFTIYTSINQFKTVQKIKNGFTDTKYGRVHHDRVNTFNIRYHFDKKQRVPDNKNKNVEIDRQSKLTPDTEQSVPYDEKYLNEYSNTFRNENIKMKSSEIPTSHEARESIPTSYEARESITTSHEARESISTISETSESGSTLHKKKVSISTISETSESESAVRGISESEFSRILRINTTEDTRSIEKLDNKNTNQCNNPKFNESQENKLFDQNESLRSSQDTCASLRYIYIIEPTSFHFPHCTAIPHLPDISLVLTMLCQKQEMVVLEAGHGSGIMCEFLARNCSKVYSIEKQKERINEHIRDNVTLWHGNVAEIAEDLSCPQQNLTGNHIEEENKTKTNKMDPEVDVGKNIEPNCDSEAKNIHSYFDERESTLTTKQQDASSDHNSLDSYKTSFKSHDSPVLYERDSIFSDSRMKIRRKLPLLDAIFLDIPDPVSALPSLMSLLRPSAKLCVYVISVQQVLATVKKLEQLGCHITVFENISREYRIIKRNIGDMVELTEGRMHTAYLIFGETGY